MEMIILFSRRPIVKATSGYYICKMNIPMFKSIIFQIDLFNTVFISSTLFSASAYPTVFLPLIAGEFHKGRLWNAQAIAIYSYVNSNPSINNFIINCHQIPI